MTVEEKKRIFQYQTYPPPPLCPPAGPPPSVGPHAARGSPLCPQPGSGRPFLLCTLSVRAVITHNFLFKGIVQLGK